MLHELNTAPSPEGSAGEGFGMDVSLAEDAATWLERTHQEIVQSLGKSSSLLLGLIGMFATGWLMYHLVILAIPGIQFNVGTFHRPIRHSALSEVTEKTYWALDSLPAQVRRKTPLHRAPHPLSATLANFTQTVKNSKDLALQRYLKLALSAQQLHQYLKTYLQAKPPRARHYTEFFARNFFRAGVLHMDMALFFSRSLLFGLLLLFSIRLFFDNSIWSKE